MKYCTSCGKDVTPVREANQEASITQVGSEQQNEHIIPPTKKKKPIPNEVPPVSRKTTNS